MRLKVAHLVLLTERPVVESGTKLRGYIGSAFQEYPILHHHVKEGYLYVYPRVQYRVIGGVPSILGIEEGAEVLALIMDRIEELSLGEHRYTVVKKVYAEERAELNATRSPKRYRFLTPWLALNTSNYRRYRSVGWKERKDILNRVLVGNILSMCKSLGMVVEEELEAHTKIEEQPVEYKGISLIGMTGEFEVNFKIPDLFAIGKGVSQGFGVVKGQL